ncbi:MAG: hypothetical protein AAGG48_13740 [Planctomycetota bacterium]
MRQETVLNVFPGQDENQRLVIAIEQEPGQESRLVLRQESYSEAIGWFIQSRVAIEPNQVAGLRLALGGSTLGASSTRQGQSPAQEAATTEPAILSFSAAAG